MNTILLSYHGFAEERKSYRMGNTSFLGELSLSKSLLMFVSLVNVTALDILKLLKLNRRKYFNMKNDTVLLSK